MLPLQEALSHHELAHSMRACRKLKTCSTRSSESEQMIAPRLRELAERVWAAMAAEL